MVQDTLRRFRIRIRQAWWGVPGLQWRVLAVLGLGAVALISTLLGTLLDDAQTWGGAVVNLGTEMAGAVVTYVLLQRVIGGRERKEDLIAQMGSDVRDVAVPAAAELRRRGWLTDGSLIRADLREADLSGADLSVANLSVANLSGADLSEADLSWAYLNSAFLWASDLSKADLEGADLSGAFLRAADLSEANLKDATVTLEQLEQAANLEGAIMPNGTKHE